MIPLSLHQPKNIAIIGASENRSKPGGKVLQNLIHGNFQGKIFAVNKKKLSITGVEHYDDVSELPKVDLVILAIPAVQCMEVIPKLLKQGTKAFIIFSAGFGEAGPEGKKMEQELTRLMDAAGACLIGPNCIGVITESYKAVFTVPVPEYDPKGCELISSSGATAVFIMEAGMLNGLRFSNVYSIGNSAQTGVEELLEHMDLHWQESSPKVKLLYLENIRNPFKFMKHASSLVRKGCMIAAIKSGHSDAGQRAASSHTGALATSDVVVRAMFKKAGVIYCSSRDELITVAGILQSKPLQGKKLAIITHAGGSAVMLTDALVNGGLQVPLLSGAATEQLLVSLHPGSSVSNPIDFLATGTGEQLSEIIEFCEQHKDIDGMVVVFGSPGLLNSVREVYIRIHQKIQSCSKPIYPVLPSLMNARQEIKEFLHEGHVNFPDEVSLGQALPYVYFRPEPTFGMTHLAEMETASIRSFVAQYGEGFLSTIQTSDLLKAAGISVVDSMICYQENDVLNSMEHLNPPWVMKVIGHLHKTEVNGVSLNLHHRNDLIQEFHRLMAIPGAQGVELQEMKFGEEFYIGAVREGLYGHLILCGLGGIFLEIIRDIANGLAPLNKEEALQMVRSLKAFPLIQGYRGRPGLPEDQVVDAIVRVASLVHLAPEIVELDINPLMVNQHEIIAVDARIRLEMVKHQ